MNLWTEVKTPTGYKNSCCLQELQSHAWEDEKFFKTFELQMNIKKIYSFFFFYIKHDCYSKSTLVPLNAAQQRGRRGKRPDLWHHVRPPGDLLLRMPTQLHSLPESVWASAGLLALALQLQRVPGSLSSHHALSLVGGTHFWSCVKEHTTYVSKCVCACVLCSSASFSDLHTNIRFLFLLASTRKLCLLAWYAKCEMWPFLL